MVLQHSTGWCTVIRREELPNLDPVNGRGFREMRAAVKRGESVRIVGLGVIKREAATDGDYQDVCIGGIVRRHLIVRVGCRLILTAAVAKDETAVTAFGGDLLAADVRRLARALGAPVEVWAPAKGHYATINDTRVWQRGKETLITTVQP